jgi:hypothetical protein
MASRIVKPQRIVFRSRAVLGGHRLIGAEARRPNSSDQVFADPSTGFDETTERAFRVQ